MTTYTPSIRYLLIPAVEAVGTDRYAMAATIGFLTLYFKDHGLDGSDGRTTIPPDQLPASYSSDEMTELLTWWELTILKEPLSGSGSDEALFVEVAKVIRDALGETDLT